jgi:hypothetical protein
MNLLEKDNFLSDLSAELSKLMEKADEYLTALSTYPDQILWTLEEYPELHSQIEENFHHSKLYSGEEVIIDQLYTASYRLNSKVDYVIFRNLYQDTLSGLLSEKVASEENLAMLLEKGQKIFTPTTMQEYRHHLNELRGIYETFQQNILAPFFQLNDLMIQGDKLFEFQRDTLPSGFEVAFQTISNDLGKQKAVFEEISSLAKSLPNESDVQNIKSDTNIAVWLINKQQYISQVGYVAHSLAFNTNQLQVQVEKLLEDQIDLYDLITIVQSGEYEDEYASLKNISSELELLPSVFSEKLTELEVKQEEGAGNYSKEIEQLTTYKSMFDKLIHLVHNETSQFQRYIYLLLQNLVACAKREH